MKPTIKSKTHDIWNPYDSYIKQSSSDWDVRYLPNGDMELSSKHSLYPAGMQEWSIRFSDFSDNRTSIVLLAMYQEYDDEPPHSVWETEQVMLDVPYQLLFSKQDLLYEEPSWLMALLNQDTMEVAHKLEKTHGVRKIR